MYIVFTYFSAIPNRFGYYQNACFRDIIQGRSWVNVDDTHDWVRYKEGVSPRVKLGQNSLLEIDGGVGGLCHGIRFPVKVGTQK